MFYNWKDASCLFRFHHTDHSHRATTAKQRVDRVEMTSKRIQAQETIKRNYKIAITFTI